MAKQCLFCSCQNDNSRIRLLCVSASFKKLLKFIFLGIDHFISETFVLTVAYI